MKSDRRYLPAFTLHTAFSAICADQADRRAFWLAEMDKNLHGLSVVDNVKQTIREAISGGWDLDQWEIY